MSGRSPGPPKSSNAKKTIRATGSTKANPALVPTRSAMPSLGDNNCLHCKRFNRCDNPDKAYDFVCGSFKLREKMMSLEDFGDAPAPTINRVEKDNNGKIIVSKAPALIIPEKKVVRVTAYSDATSEEFDIERMIESLTNNTTGLPADLRVDDRDLPEAPNFMTFCSSPEFLNYKPWAKQVEIGTNLFSEACLHCSDRTYLNCIPTDASLDQIKERVVFLNHGICPQCARTRLDMWEQYGLKKFNELAGLAGQRSGKSRLSALLSAYTLHRFMKLQPIPVFNLMPNDILYGTFTAPTFKQAREAMFDPLYNIVRDSPWFMAYHEMLDHYGRKYGEELYKFKDIFFQYRHRNLHLSPASPDKKNLRGRAQFCSCVDELGWLFAKTTNAIKLDPNEIYTAMTNSFLTLRAAHRKLTEAGYHNIPPPLFCSISSPSSAQDKMVQLVKNADRTPNIYAFHYSVFEMNPEIKPVDLEDKAINDPIAYKRDFLAIPPDSSNPFIADRKAVLACVDPKHVNLVKTTQGKFETSSGVLMTGASVHVRRKKFNQMNQPPRILTMDAGHTFNSFACCVMHMEDISGRLVPCVDALVEVIPKPEEPISFTEIHHSVISPLIEEMNVTYVGADRWNSIKMLHDLEDEHEIDYTVYSVEYKDMLELRHAIMSQELILPKAELKLAEVFEKSGRDYPYSMEGSPVSHLMLQILTVEDQMGRRVDKGQGYTDDLFRAMSLGHALILDEEVQNIFMRAPKTGGGALGAIVSYAGGGSFRTPGGSAGSSRLGVVGSYGSGGSMAMSGTPNAFARRR